MTEVKKKMYIALLRYDNQQKRVYLEGNDDQKSEMNFDKILNELPDIARASKDWPDYIEKAIRHFTTNGYVRIAK